MYRKGGFGESVEDTEDDLQGEFITSKIVKGKLTSESFSKGTPKMLTKEAYAKATGIDVDSFDEEELRSFTEAVKEYITVREKLAAVSQTNSFNTADLQALISAAETAPGAISRINSSSSFFGKSGVNNFDELKNIAASGKDLSEVVESYGISYENFMSAVGKVSDIVNQSSNKVRENLNKAEQGVEKGEESVSWASKLINKEALTNDISTFATYTSYISTGITSLFDTVDAALDKGIEGTEKAQKINQGITGILSSVGGLIATVTTGNAGIGVAVSGLVTTIGSAYIPLS